MADRGIGFYHSPSGDHIGESTDMIPALSCMVFLEIA